MPAAAPQTVRLADYTPPAHLVERVALRFELAEDGTRVHTSMRVRRNPAHAHGGAPLALDGADLELLALRLDGRELSSAEYAIDAERLTIENVPEQFSLEVETRIHPETNTSLEGLYKSGGAFCTQCEAEGFRKITWYPDRPDVMARFTTTIVADRTRYPVLLSNGNDIERGDLDDGRHFVTWEDPFPKPSYLFALVAGRLACIEDRFTTRSGREVRLRIYVEPHNDRKCDHAMASLKKAMAWDEQVYGLEYDLDTFMIVAVDDFNMGAMENKGLNIFNSKYVLAQPETATDQDYAGIEGVIAHEYFHNWTGNRVTCRDWFQLSLKEGLTVFRDQQFSADMGSAPVKRIQDVRILRAHQFAEDAGPMAHPVRPDAYIEISNFYTVTIYNKGAEVIRMIHGLLGAQNFRKGMDLYFRRHDGQAVTTDDFVQAMQDASGVDLNRFRRWYWQAGTPVVEADGHWDEASRRYLLTLRQSCPPTPGQAEKEPFHVPVAIGLVDEHGNDIAALPPHGVERRDDGDTHTLVIGLTEREQSFEFAEVPSRPRLSLGRNFSAPVRFVTAREAGELAFLMGHDRDAFNRWDAGQEFASDLLLRLVAEVQAGREPHLPDEFRDAVARTLSDQSLDAALRAEAMRLPGESLIADRMSVIDADAIHTARQSLVRALGGALAAPLQATYDACRSNAPYQFDAGHSGRRGLKNICLAYLVESASEDAIALAGRQFDSADNMTDSLGALAALANVECAERDRALAAFAERWRDDPLVMDKWFALQATSHLPDTLANVERLLEHPAFDMRNPNRIRAVIGAFCHGNQVRFHDASGAGYRFLADRVLDIDPRNPQVAARLAGAFSRWRRFDPQRQQLMRAAMERIRATTDLSKDTYEVVSKTLADSGAQG